MGRFAAARFLRSSALASRGGTHIEVDPLSLPSRAAPLSATSCGAARRYGGGLEAAVADACFFKIGTGTGTVGTPKVDASAACSGRIRKPAPVRKRVRAETG